MRALESTPLAVRCRPTEAGTVASTAADLVLPSDDAPSRQASEVLDPSGSDASFGDGVDGERAELEQSGDSDSGEGAPLPSYPAPPTLEELKKSFRALGGRSITASEIAARDRDAPAVPLNDGELSDDVLLPTRNLERALTTLGYARALFTASARVFVSVRAHARLAFRTATVHCRHLARRLS